MAAWIVFLSAGFICLPGCGDDDDDNNDTSDMANIVYECNPSSGTGVYQFSNGMDGYVFNYSRSMEETAGIGVQLEEEVCTTEVEGRPPHSSTSDCEYMASRYDLPNCYLPGNHKAVDYAGGWWISDWWLADATLVKFTYTLTGIDDNGNHIAVTTSYEGTVP